MLVLGVLSVLALLLASAVPTLAFAHTATAITVPAATVTTGASTYLGTGTVTYLKDGRTFGVSGQQVKIHRYDFAKKIWVYIATRGTDSAGAFDLLLPGGETFRYSYAGSRYLAASSAEVRVDLLPGTPLPFVVTIDAGHQSIRSRVMEPIGPGSHTKKPAAVSGTSGRYTHTPEYTRNLQVALKLRDRLVHPTRRLQNASKAVASEESVSVVRTQQPKLVTEKLLKLCSRLRQQPRGLQDSREAVAGEQCVVVVLAEHPHLLITQLLELRDRLVQPPG